MTQILNQDFDLNTFYWQYVRCNAGTVTYTVECFDVENGISSEEPYLTIMTSTGALNAHLCIENSERHIAVEIVEAVRKHFSRRFMLEDGHMMLAEYYVCGASGELHQHAEYGQAIFGMDLEEAYSHE